MRCLVLRFFTGTKQTLGSVYAFKLKPLTRHIRKGGRYINFLLFSPSRTLCQLFWIFVVVQYSSTIKIIWRVQMARAITNKME